MKMTRSMFLGLSMLTMLFAGCVSYDNKLPPTFAATNSRWRMQRNEVYRHTDHFVNGTYDLETGDLVELKKGYQVSIQTDDSEWMESPGYMSDADYDAAVEYMIKRTGSRVYLGVWDIPEISFCVEDKQLALELLERFKQGSAWDWEKGILLFRE